MNIFETIAKVTSGIEQFHSQFLTDSLEESLSGDRSLFDSVWRLATPDWEMPVHAQVWAEEQVERGAVDICIRTTSPRERIIGIEVKTVDSSAALGQLERYRKGLTEKYPSADVQIAYLTPFNTQRAGDASSFRPTIKEFQQFSSLFPQARHLSWLDIADISWDANPLWTQHQTYVREHISAPLKLRVNTEWNRNLSVFFGEEATQNFWEELALFDVHAGQNGAIIDFSPFRGNLPRFASSLISILQVLLGSDSVSRHANRSDKFPPELRRPFINSEYREVHEALFRFADLHPYLWVQGKKDYAIRTAHKNHSSGVSLLRTEGPGRIVVGERR